MTPPTIEQYQTELELVKRTCQQQQSCIRELQSIAIVALASMIATGDLDPSTKAWLTVLINRAGEATHR